MSKAELKDIENTFLNNLKSVLPDFKISAKNNVLNILFRSMAGYIYQLKRKSDRNVETLTNIDNTSGTDLDYRASFWGVTRIEAQKAQGLVVYTGDVGAVIPTEAYVLGGDFIVTSSNAVQEQIYLANASIVNQVATITLNGIINQLPNTIKINIINPIIEEVTIFDANETTFKVTLLSPIADGTYTITFKVTIGTILVESIETGFNKNIQGNTQGELSNLFNNVNPILIVSPQGITGGIDLESDARLKQRWAIVRTGYIAQFSPDSIKFELLTNFSNLTRVFVLRATPSGGKCTIFPIYENRANILPTNSEINSIKLFLNTIVPATISVDNDVLVIPITLIPYNVSLANIVPNTPNMNVAVKNTLKAYFLTEVINGTSVNSLSIERYLLNNTVDVFNNKLQSITINSSQQSASLNELIVLGNVS